MDPIFMACPMCDKGVEVWADNCPYCGANLYAPKYEEETPPPVSEPESPTLYDTVALWYGVLMASLLVICVLVGIVRLIF